VFKILIHIDVVKDFMFYHYARDELIADGKTAWRDFSWQYGRADGDLEEDELHPVTKQGQPDDQPPRRHPGDDDDRDDGSRRSHSRGMFKKLSGCMDPRGRGREQHQDSNRYQGGDRREAPRHRTREAINDIPSHGWPFEEQRALRQLWQAKGEKNWLDCSAKETRNPHHEYSELKMFIEGNQFKSEAIMISPMEDMFSHQPQQISIDQGLVQHPPSTNQGAQQANQVSKDL
jgi:hypothetical protein